MSTRLFHQRIRASIANESLQAALDANAERRVKGRITALATLPDWRERRQRAHAIRAEVITHLDDYLKVFTGKLVENGFIVHRAADKADALKIILDITAATTRKPLLFAKSKSMISEEIELNHSLEAMGHRVVETDLGEYIVNCAEKSRLISLLPPSICVAKMWESYFMRNSAFHIRKTFRY